MKSRLVEFLYLGSLGWLKNPLSEKYYACSRTCLQEHIFQVVLCRMSKNYLLARHLWMQVLGMKKSFSRWTACKYKHRMRCHLALSHGPLQVDSEQLWFEVSIVNRYCSIKISTASSAAHWFCMYKHAVLPFSLVIESWNGSYWKII